MPHPRLKYHQQYYLRNKRRLKKYQKEYQKSYYARHKEYYKLWRKNNKLKIVEYHKRYRNKKKHYMRLYLQINKTKYQVYQRTYREKRRQFDVNFKIAEALRSRLNVALKHQCKNGSAVRDLGCSIGEFKSHIASKFQDGMTWKNYGKWHLDHIVPLSKFDLTDRTQLLIACHYTNYQPLWAFDNISKGKFHVLDFRKGVF